MKIAISGSLKFAYEMQQLKEQLEKIGFEVILPPTAVEIINGKEKIETIEKEKQKKEMHKRGIKYDGIRRYYEMIKNSDVLLVANYEKNNVKGYVGGNTFLEMGFAHILNLPIFMLFSPSKQLSYYDEIMIMQPIILKNNLEKIKEVLK